MIEIFNLVTVFFVIIIILLIVIIAQRKKDGSYISALKKSIEIKKLEITERALSMDLDDSGLPPIEKLIASGKIVKMEEKEIMPPTDKIENKIGFK